MMYRWTSLALLPRRGWQLLAGLLLCTASWAGGGTITHLSGTVTITGSSGVAQVATAGTPVNEGDTLVTGAVGYVRMEMSDGGEMILRPNSQLKIEAYNFEPDKPQDDKFFTQLIKGGMRALTGLISKRGDRGAYQLRTVTSTIGIRGTQFDGRICQGNCGALPDGDYFAVRFGAIVASNPTGSLLVPVGKVVFIPPLLAPVMLPRDPGIGFTPPPVIPKLDIKKSPEAVKPTENASPAPPARDSLPLLSPAVAKPPAAPSVAAEECSVQ
jgi:hypothetical protein